jgi:hypothetical protein
VLSQCKNKSHAISVYCWVSCSNVLPGSVVSHVPNKINDLLILKATKRFNSVPGHHLFNKLAIPVALLEYGLQPTISTKSWLVGLHRPRTRGFCGRERNFRIFRQQLLQHPPLTAGRCWCRRTSIGVERDQRVRVVQQFLDQAHVVSVCDERTCQGTPQRVETDLSADACLPRRRLEMVGHQHCRRQCG